MLKLLFIFLLEHKKDPGIPNLFPFKEEVLKQAEEKKRRVIFFRCSFNTMYMHMLQVNMEFRSKCFKLILNLLFLLVLIIHELGLEVKEN